MTTMDNGLGSGSEAAMSDAAANGAPSFAISDGIVTTDIAVGNDAGQSVAVQADGAASGDGSSGGRLPRRHFIMPGVPYLMS